MEGDVHLDAISITCTKDDLLEICVVMVMLGNEVHARVHDVGA